jgi:predicted Zn-dependent protease
MASISGGAPRRRLYAVCWTANQKPALLASLQDQVEGRFRCLLEPREARVAEYVAQTWREGLVGMSCRPHGVTHVVETIETPN